MNGKFIISLDFELMWGVRDKKDKTTYGNNILGVHKVIPKLLEIFSSANCERDRRCGCLCLFRK